MSQSMFWWSVDVSKNGTCYPFDMYSILVLKWRQVSVI